MESQPVEACGDPDSWVGVADSAERRRRQNRVHQRAYRQKRHMRRIALVTAGEPTKSGPPAEGALVPTSNPEISRVPSTNYAGDVLQHVSIFYLLQHHSVRENIEDLLKRAAASWALNRPLVQDLSALTRVIAFDALARNAILLGIPVELIESDDGTSLFNYEGPVPPGAVQQVFPPDLCPTALQKAVRHHPWLDIFPIPKIRDNILRGIQSGELDEDQISMELGCDLLDLDSPSDSSLVLWGNAWDAHGWEFSPGFFKRWAVLLRDCPEIVTATNYWRQKRGAEKIHETIICTPSNQGGTPHS